MEAREPENNFNGIEVQVKNLTTDSQKSESSVSYCKRIEIVYLTQGKLNVWLSDDFFELNVGEMLIINFDEPHRMESIAPQSEFVSINLLPGAMQSTQSLPWDLNIILPFTLGNSTKQRVFPAPFLEKNAVDLMMRNTVEESRKRQMAWELAIRSNVYRIICVVLRYWESIGVNFEVSVSDKNLLQTIQSAVEYINSRYTDITEKEVADWCGLSYSYFSRSFKKIMTISFSEYINYLKISQAQKLLLSTDMSVAEIASHEGFSSASHFIQTFKKYKGCQPKKFRMYFVSNTKEQKGE